MTTLEYWVTSSKDDLDAADKLFTAKKYHHALFFVHLSLEKVLKALFVSKNNLPAPAIHDLVRLAEKAELRLDQETIDQLAEISTFNIAARYDDYKFKFYKKATETYAKNWLKIGKAVYNTFLQHL